MATQPQVSNLKIPTYLPLADAAQKYGLSETVLTQLIQAGKKSMKLVANITVFKEAGDGRL
jgi:hypothetical protein